MIDYQRISCYSEFSVDQLSHIIGTWGQVNNEDWLGKEDKMGYEKNGDYPERIERGIIGPEK